MEMRLHNHLRTAGPLLRAALAVAVLLLTLAARAERQSFPLGGQLAPDETRREVERAVTMWLASARPVATPAAPVSLTLEPNAGVAIEKSEDLLFVKPSDTPGAVRAIVISADGRPASGDLKQGEWTRIGSSYSLRWVDLTADSKYLVQVRKESRSAAAAAAGSATAPPAYDPEATGVWIASEDSPARLVVISRESLALAFISEYIENRRQGMDPDTALRVARRRQPAPAPTPAPGATTAAPARAAAATATAGERATPAPRRTERPTIGSEIPRSVLLTFGVQGGSRVSGGATSGNLRVESFGGGGRGGRTQVGGSAGGAGGQVHINKPGKYQYSFGASEGETITTTTNDTFLLVPMNGEASGSLVDSAGRYVEVTAAASPAGRSQVRVEMDFRTGGQSWTTTVLVRDGQTLTVGGSSGSTTTSSRSGVPILSDVPYAGGAVGNRSQTRSTGSSAFTVSARFQ